MTPTLVVEEEEEEPYAHVLVRGDYRQLGERVTADVPHSLPPMPEGAPRNRLGLAQWLVQPEHPLTARVVVNRFWAELFGQGLVTTPGDFGLTGSPPSHPELLDWLAVEFRESGWDVKRLFRSMVTSATYQQLARVTALKRELDPENHLLSRGARFRMDGEMVRDLALQASGLLVPVLGGPSVKPYQPDNVWEVVGTGGGQTETYEQDTGEALYRRSLYTFWRRQAPPPALEIFNAPSREYSVVQRDRTNTPLQALVGLNDVQLVEAARALASLALEGATTTRARLDLMATRVLARPLDDGEHDRMQAALDPLLVLYQDDPAAARELVDTGESQPNEDLDVAVLAAWTLLANTLLNLDEALNQ